MVYVTEFVLEESRFISALQVSTDQTKQAFGEISNYFANLPSQIYPTIVGLHRYMVEINQDERFQFGLDVLLDGLEQRLLKSKTQTPASSK